jgi:hypothetical protein
MDLAHDFLVRPGGAERLTVEDDLAPIDLQPRDARLRDRGAEQQGEYRRKPREILRVGTRP